MKKIITIIAIILCLPTVAQAVKMKDLKIYINPGHGGYDADDRNILIYPFTSGDSLGFWESKSNLYKGLHMYHILDSLGSKAYLSRIKNTTEDDRSLSGISEEANNNNCDLFFSIHSNAGETVNYPLMLYRESKVGTPRYPEAVTLSNILWDNLHSSKLSIWTRDTRYVSGDLTFYPQWGTSGLGVLRNLYLVGLLSEGQMHEHRPEAHRLMNDDFLWLEAWHFVKSIMEYFNTDDRFVTGNIAGVAYDDNNTRENTLQDRFSRYGRDCNMPLNGTNIILQDISGKTIQTRTTDDMNNGVFVFRNVVPGTYKIVANKDGFYQYTKQVEVVANEVVYDDIPMSLKRETPLVIESYSPNVTESELVSCVEPIKFKFNHDILASSVSKSFKIEPAIEGEITYSNSYHEVQFKPLVSFETNTSYKVTLTTDLCTPDPYYSQSHLSQDFSFNFTTIGRNKLEMIKSFPEEGGTVHYQNATLEFRFDKKLNATNLYNYITIYDSKGNTVAINKRTSTSNKLSNGYGNVVLVINSNLNIGEKYRVVLSPELKDEEGVPLTDEITINFSAVNVGTQKEGTVLEEFENKDIFVFNNEESHGLTSDVVPYLITSNKLFGNASVQLSYDFSNMKGGEAVVNYVGAMNILHKDDVVGIHVKGDLNDHELLLGFTAGTDTKYFKVCNLDFVGWHYYSLPLVDLEYNTDYIFSKVKLIQKDGLYAQKGNVNLDNFIKSSTSGVENIQSDANDIKIDIRDGSINVISSDSILGLELYNMQGSLITVSNKSSLNYNSINKGIYLLKVKSDTRQFSKIIILK